MNKKWIQNKGFTLIEFLLYIAIIGTLLLATTTLLILLLQSRVKNQTILEVDQQGNQIMQILSQTLRNSEIINSPAPGANATTLSINTGTDDPTLFSLSGNTLQITEGVNPAIDLTNTKVSITNLNFENLSRPDTPGNIRITFTISYVSNSTQNEYQYEKTFHTTASLRHPL